MHGWYLELAISSFTTTTSHTTTATGGNDDNLRSSSISSQLEPPLPPPPPGLAWKIIKLHVSVIYGSLWFISGAVGLGLWAAGGVLSYSLGFMGLVSGSGTSSSSDSVSVASTEAMDFVVAFERDYGMGKPNFVSEGFMDMLQRSRNLFKLLFVYLHSPAS